MTAPSRLPLGHERILASAGSGKTFALVGRYLRLLETSGCPDDILASTFTRLAAGEIRGRILLRLAEAADDAAKREELARLLGAANLPRSAVLERLALLARSIHRMNIRTLDSFFASIVRAFALELGVAPEARVMDETEAAPLRAEAIARLLNEQEPQHLVDLLRLLTQGRSERAVTATIDRTVADLYTVFREALPEAWAYPPEASGELALTELVEAIEHLHAVPVEGKQFSKAHTGDCARARAWNWKEFLTKGLSGSLAAEKDTYYKALIPEALQRAYQPLVIHARAACINRARDQTIATRGLLQLFHAHYEAVKRERGVLTFADLIHTLDQAMTTGAYDEVCYRLDSGIEHVLLDEFQDTSVPQWRVLAPLIMELARDETRGRTFFCVGDVKQSIYGWRSAAPEILEHLPTLIFGKGGESAMHDQVLAKSWRSAPVIMETVNQVFTSLDGHPAVEGAPQAAVEWMEGFVPHTTARDTLAGRVELHMLAVQGNKAQRARQRLARAAEMIADLHRQAPELSIGVLARENKAVTRLLFELGPARLAIPAGGRGGGSLTDSPVVNALLDVLQLAEQPDDTIAAFHIANSPLGPIVGLHDHGHKEQRRACSREIRSRLLRDGFSASIAWWLERAAASSAAHELHRALHLIDLADRWDESGAWRPGEFITFVRDQRITDTRPAPVQVMSIHQSKGLEFDIVVLPELDVDLIPSRAPVVFTRDGITGPINRVCRWMAQEVRALTPEVEPMFADYRARQMRESLCLLYVAMTRAKRGLFMLIEQPTNQRNNSVSKRLSSLLRCTLAPEADEPGLIHAAGDASWLRGQAREQSSSLHHDPHSSGERITLAPAKGRVDRYRSAPSPSAAGAEHEPLAWRLAMPNEAALARGSVMHALFESIDWLAKDEEHVIDESHHALLSQPGRRADPGWTRECLRDFQRMLREPAIAALFDRTRYGDDAIVEREFPFIRRTREGLQTGLIDRLVRWEDATGRVLRVEIIDFKTDRVEPSHLAERVERYRPQLAAYGEAMMSRFGLSREAVALRLAFVEVGRVVDVH